MSDLSFVLKENVAWKELLRALAMGRVPHALSVILPWEFAETFAALYAKRILCSSGTGEDVCDSCRMWGTDGHPDLIVLGDREKAPAVAECVPLHGQLSLRPVIAPRRLAVVFRANELLGPSAAALLKITEEPPLGGCLLFLAERDNVLPTIASRTWTLRLDASPERVEPSRHPNDAAEWAAWLEKTKKYTVKDFAAEAAGWVTPHGDRCDKALAASIDNLFSLAEKRRMPASMLQDALFALLEEGVEVGDIFGDLRET